MNGPLVLCEAVSLVNESFKCDGLSYVYLKPLASSRSPTALKRLCRSKECHYLQFALSASLAFCITLGVCNH